MITLTLDFPWESIRTYTERHVKTKEGPRIDVISLSKALLNSPKKISIDNHIVKFDEDLLRNGITINSPIIYFQGVNFDGADGFVKNVKYHEEQIEIYYYDSNPVIGLKSYSYGEIKIPTFGMDFNELFNILEETSVIRRISVFSFLILNKDAFYKLSGCKRLSFAEALETIKSIAK